MEDEDFEALEVDLFEFDSETTCRTMQFPESATAKNLQVQTRNAKNPRISNPLGHCLPVGETPSGA
jgi:hypothetical protein